MTFKTIALISSIFLVNNQTFCMEPNQQQQNNDWCNRLTGRVLQGIGVAGVAATAAVVTYVGDLEQTWLCTAGTSAVSLFSLYIGTQIIKHPEGCVFINDLDERIIEIEDKMQAAADDLDFEKAIVLRDELRLLKKNS